MHGSSQFYSGLVKPGIGPEQTLLTQCHTLPVLILICSGLYHWSAVTAGYYNVMFGTDCTGLVTHAQGLKQVLYQPAVDNFSAHLPLARQF